MQEPEYILEDAAAVVFQSIPKDLQKKLSYLAIMEILETEFEFLEQCHIAASPDSVVDILIEVPVKLDEEAMEYYIINQCAKKDIYLSYEDIQAILNAELIYLEQQGLLDDEVPGKYLN
ncbi:hypothetical protein CLV24_104145 [Pontibacter ummariensis]|uniref:Uncharacterized protein n=1 Tax=Pontibacter ummariensis TaxID=1610492 RepID=A0A239DCU8_9BACT|nr:hypothetical protein [Pontibacter ummariensis]PRY14335.1 hypothetical protein CLV24_104145 [Pontibacter ummariensis]SNS29493.1 hypothetical protein SAMN06296052_104144 [Pontibacter ummariensis]